MRSVRRLKGGGIMTTPVCRGKAGSVGGGVSVSSAGGPRRGERVASEPGELKPRRAAVRFVDRGIGQD